MSKTSDPKIIVVPEDTPDALSFQEILHWYPIISAVIADIESLKGGLAVGESRPLSPTPLKVQIGDGKYEWDLGTIKRDA